MITAMVATRVSSRVGQCTFLSSAQHSSRNVRERSIGRWKISGVVMLRDQIASLQAKGVDASESWVDLHLKIALPVASFVLMLVAVPLAARGTRVSSLPAAVGLGFVIGFSYFIVLAFTRALGQTGALPPLLAAWTSNLIFVLIGAYHLLGSD